MRTFTLVCALVMTAFFAQAQQMETLSSSFKHKGGSGKKLSAYGALLGKISTFDDRFAVLTGGYGGVFLNKKIMLGAGAYSMATSPRVDNYNDNRRWNLWYTGGVVEYVHNSDKLFHWSAGALIGGGGVSQRIGFDKGRDQVYESDGFFVAEPFINAEVNITSYLRIVAGGTWRQVAGAGIEGMSDSKMSGPGFHLGVKAGVF
ncbi:hypothetical protein ACFOTA_16010 [Chitinophaga sp. GCM10012297]|uniref:Outer membrane protein beta-barrel domain-containing protein n=1 Tax=Chitinophaga chungangae TaxID=2821488 RepID=A0ABS3YGE5_9BACT|nr:hypothetical protein [Chitinophaga chungangae]MBO9153724.1 hypothetical protein [Chitinophaga chungangae]